MFFLHILIEILRAARFFFFGGGGILLPPIHTHLVFFFFIRSKLTNKHYSSFKKALNEHFQCIVSG